MYTNVFNICNFTKSSYSINVHMFYKVCHIIISNQCSPKKNTCRFSPHPPNITETKNFTPIFQKCRKCALEKTLNNDFIFSRIQVNPVKFFFVKISKLFLFHLVSFFIQRTKTTENSLNPFI